MDSNLIGAVYAIPPYDRETWVRVAMALKSEFGDAAHALWDSWSRQDDRPQHGYNAHAANSTWKAMQAKGRRCHDRYALLSCEATRLDW